MEMQQQDFQRPETHVVGRDRLGLRVLALIDSPLARLGRRVRIHRLETDAERDWGAVMEVLASTSGLQMDFESEGSVILQWESPGDLEMALSRSCTTVDRSNDEAPF